MQLLYIGQDNVFEELDVPVDYISTRHTITPGATSARNGVRIWLLVLGRSLRRRYTHVMVPAINPEWDNRFHRVKHTVRKLMRRSAVQRLIRLTCRVLFGRATFVLLDRWCDSDIKLMDIAIFKPAIYFKVNLPQHARHDETRLSYLPYWISDPAPGWAAGSEERDVDVFFAGDRTSEPRKILPEVQRKLEERGYRVYMPEDRMEPDAYFDALKRSKLALSPEGVGWHCFRHYEALARGAIPVINRPEPPLETDLVHLDNCLFYRDADDLVDVCDRFLKGELSLKQSAGDRVASVREKHTMNAVGRYILDHLM